MNSKELVGSFIRVSSWWSLQPLKYLRPPKTGKRQLVIDTKDKIRQDKIRCAMCPMTINCGKIEPTAKGETE